MIERASMIASLSASRRPRIPGCAAVLVLAAVVAIPKVASACTTYGLIDAKWQQVKGTLGGCVDDEHDDGVGGRIQSFAGGYISWVYPNPAAYVVYLDIAGTWTTRYGGWAVTGQPTSDEYGSGYREADFKMPGSSAYTHIVKDSSCGNYDDVCILYGAIGSEWNYYLEPNYGVEPLDDPYNYGGGSNAKQDFENGWVITWNSSNGATCTFFYGTLYHGPGGCALP